MNYDLKKPCDLCPFRNDEKRLFVDPARLAGMARGEFACHKTAELKEDEETGEGTYEPTEKSQHCAGLLIFLEKQNAPHQMMRISERLGMYDHTKLDMKAPVFGSMAEVRKASRKLRQPAQ
jgi:hypothetical protein